MFDSMGTTCYNASMNLINELQKKIKESGVPVRQICINAGLHESTYYRAIKRGYCGTSTYEILLKSLSRLKQSA